MSKKYNDLLKRVEDLENGFTVYSWGDSPGVLSFKVTPSEAIASILNHLGMRFRRNAPSAPVIELVPKKTGKEKK